MLYRAPLPLAFTLSAAALLALCSGSAGAQDPEEKPAEGIIETRYPGGSLHERYGVDEDGERDGDFEEFREDGSLKVRAKYSDGKLHGVYTELDEEGELLIEARYAKGKKNGFYRTYEEGARTLDATYRGGVLHGRYETMFFDGSYRFLGNHKQGVLDGRMQEFKPEEKWEHSGTYKKGVLHGRSKISVSRKVVGSRKWDMGQLVELDGLEPFPRREKELREEISRASVVPAGNPEDPLSEDRMYALMRLRVYRALCGLHWDHMELHEEWNNLCDAASEVCEANGGLSHSPDQPDGFDDARFAEGFTGASNSNLASGGLRRSVEMYMDDSDPSNIDRVGHRRWCLNPTMGKTGFGSSGNYAAMWSMDGSGPSPKKLDAVFYPPKGYVPTDLFGSRYAWSIQIYKGKVPKGDEDLDIEVVRLDDWFQPRGEPLELDYSHLDTGGFAGGPCIIFRPVGLRVEPGLRYRARVSVDGGKTVAYDYLVEFVEPTNSASGD